MIAFTNIFSAELYKTRRTGNLLLAMLIPFACTMMMFGYFTFRGTSNPALTEGADAWRTYSQMILALFVLMYPLFASVLAFSISNVEHKNRGLKQIFTLPAQKSSLYFSKVLIQLLWMFMSLAFALGLLYGTGALLDVFFPALEMQLNGSFAEIGSFLLKTYLTLTAIVAIHFFVSIYWNNFVISVGSACFFVVVGLIMGSWEYSYILPYSHIVTHMSALELRESTVFTTEVFWSLGYALVFFAVGFWMMLRKSITS